MRSGAFGPGPAVAQVPGMHMYNATKISSLIPQTLSTPSADTRPARAPQAPTTLTTEPVIVVVRQVPRSAPSALVTPSAPGVCPRRGSASRSGTRPGSATAKTKTDVPKGAKREPAPRLMLDFPLAAPEKTFSPPLLTQRLTPPVVDADIDDNKVDAANWLRDTLPLVASSTQYVGSQSSADYLAHSLLSLDGRAVRGLRSMLESGGLQTAIDDALWYKGIEQRPDRPLARIVRAALRRYDLVPFLGAPKLSQAAL